MTSERREVLRSQILATKKRSYSTVVIDGAEFGIQTLSQHEQAMNDIIPFRKDGTLDIKLLERQKLDKICRSVVDPESKEPLFDPTEWESLVDVGASVIAKLSAAIQEINGANEVDSAAMLGNSD